MKVARSRTEFAVAALWLAYALATLPAAAQTLEFGTLLNFKGGADGSSPTAPLVEYGGVFYSTTAGGGSPACSGGCGTVFSLTPPPSPGVYWTGTTLYSFTGGSDGGMPIGGLVVGSGGVLYGTTKMGGSANRGTVFSLTLPAPGGTWQEAVLHSFPGGGDGSYPAATLVMGSRGELYGVTETGGGPNAGTVFSMTPPGPDGGPWTQHVLYTFAGGAAGANPTKAVTIEPRTGAIYGTTRNGGTQNFGTVFLLAPPASSGGPWTKTTLHSFMDANDGAYPNELLLGDKGVIYGTTSGYSTQGNVFALEPPASPGGDWTVNVLHAFANDFIDGAFPTAGLTWGGGAFYGTTAGGGTDENCSCGTAFSLTPPVAAGGS